uniref:Uncharacterized protein n=1 Tax=viral metagenome TaxID=1070528 RepID=A0A6C0B0Y6_9ZZZZ
MSQFIKVSQGDSTNQVVDVKSVKPINNIKVIRKEESDYTSSESSYSSSSEESIPRKKKTKKVLRKKESISQRQPPRHDYSMFSNPKKISQQQNNDYDDESEYTEDSSEAGSYSEGSEAYEGEPRQQTNSFEDKQKMKQDLLIKIAALEKKGFEFTKKFNMTSNYEEMMFEYEKVKKFIESQAGIKFARRCLMACVTGIEFLNKKFDPFNIKLEGWSENVMESVDDYDNVFEKLHEKYSSKAEVAPEIELLLMLGGSAFMFHLTNSLLKGPTMSNLVGQNNPNFMAGMMGALSQGMKDMNKMGPQGMQQPMNQGPPKMPPPMETRGVRKEMRGPNLDQNLFNGTPLASNYPQPPMPPPNAFSMKTPMPQQGYNTPQNYNSPQSGAYNSPQSGAYYEENPINDDDRFSIASSESASDVSTVSLGSTVKTIKATGKKGKGGGGFELNIR